MNKLKQILEFIRALLGFLLNLKKKKTDGFLMFLNINKEVLI